MAEPVLRTLAPALRELERRLQAWLTTRHRFPLTTLQRAQFEGLAADLGRQSAALEAESPLLVIMLMGGTGVGKSTLLNALAGGQIAMASLTRPTTRDPVVYFHRSIKPDRLDPALRFCKLIAHDRPSLEHKILVDTPDIDSTDYSNRDKLLSILPVADVVLYVGSQEKYHDKLGWELFLEQRRRRAFAFVLNKWDRCQHPGVGVGPDEDLLRDLRAEGFAHPLLFRTCAQHHLDHPGTPAPVPGEQFEELTRWLQEGLNRLEIDAIKARGVSQLLAQLQESLTRACPPDLTANAQRIIASWDHILQGEALAIATVLLNSLEPYRKEIEHHFAEERQKRFSGVMALYLHGYNQLRYTGSSLRSQIPMLPRTQEAAGEPQPVWDLDRFALTCREAAAQQPVNSRIRALVNHLLVDANSQGMPVHLLKEPTEDKLNLDWKGRYSQAVVNVVADIERVWSNPTGSRWFMHRGIILLGDWLPIAGFGVMGTILLWEYTMEQRAFALTDFLLPFAVLLVILVLLHIVIAVILPLRWKSIRGEVEKRLSQRLADEMRAQFLPLPEETAAQVLNERRQVEMFLNETREVSSWLSDREQAASVDSLYGADGNAKPPSTDAAGFSALPLGDSKG